MSDVPPPRELWAEAEPGQFIEIAVKPEDGESTLKFSGDVRDFRKVGGAHDVWISLTFTTEGGLSPVEIEAGKENGEWGPFRAFAGRLASERFHREINGLHYVGRVVSVSLGGMVRGVPGREVQPMPEINNLRDNDEMRASIDV